MKAKIYGVEGIGGDPIVTLNSAIQSLNEDGWIWTDGTSKELVAESLNGPGQCKVTLKGSGFLALADVLQGGAVITDIIVQTENAKISISGFKYTVASTDEPNVVPIFTELLKLPQTNATTWSGSGKDDIIKASGLNDVASGGDGNDVLYGGAGDDKLYGGNGNDTIYGGSGNDLLWGGVGTSKLSGGSGADRFVFKAVEDSPKGLPSEIIDFSLKDKDRIDLTFMDADLTTDERQDFEFIGKAKYSGHAGELRYQKLSDGMYVAADLDGDRQTDFLLKMNNTTQITEDFFLL